MFTKEHARDLSGMECLRRAWYMAKGVESAQISTKDVVDQRRHKLLKDVARNEHQRLSKRHITIAEYRAHKEFPWIGSLVDFLQYDQTGRQGYRREGWRAVLEVRVVSSYVFRNVKASPTSADANGIDLYAVQWGMWVNGIKEGQLWMWSPEYMDGILFDVKYDPLMHDAFERNAIAIEEEIRKRPKTGTGPERISDGPECSRCQFRYACRPTRA